MLAAKQNQTFPFHFLSAPPTPPAERNKKGRKLFGFCPRESASAPEAHWFASPRNRSVRASFKPPRAPRVRSGFAQRLIHHRNYKIAPSGAYFVVAEREGFEAYSFSTPLRFFHGRAAQKYRKALRIPHAKCAGTLLLSANKICA